MQEAVEGTSAGRNEAKGELWVFLGSGGGDVVEGSLYLILSPEKSRVRMGRSHV